LQGVSANISIMYPELPFLDRFAAAAADGFRAVECWFPYDHSAGRIDALLRENGLRMVGINTAPGNAGEWGLAALPGRHADFAAALSQALDYAATCGSAVHVMAGMVGGMPRAEAEAAYLASLERAVDLAAGSGVQLLIEALNSRDRPGYFLSRSDQAAAILARPGLESLRLMFDCYHVQIEEGDLVTRLRRHYPLIGHVQIASVPDRTEPDQGEVNYAYVLSELRRLGWTGWVGAEYRPRTTTREGLGWIAALS